MTYSAKSDTTLTEKAATFNRDQSEEWQRFVAKHGDVKSYAHFDKRTSLRNPKVQDMVCDPQWVSSHGFLPFIQYDDDGRTISYASHLDRCIYQRYSFLINKKYEDYALKRDFYDAAIAYRSDLGKSNIDFAKQAFDFIKDLNNKDNAALVFVGDFSHFFESIKHDLLKEKLCKVLGDERLERDFYQVFKSVTKYAYWDLVSIYKIRLYCKNHALRERIREHLSSRSSSSMKSVLVDVLTREKDLLTEQAWFIKPDNKRKHYVRTYDVKTNKATCNITIEPKPIGVSFKNTPDKIQKVSDKLKEIEKRQREIEVLLKGLEQNEISVDWAEIRNPNNPAVFKNKVKFLSRREMNAPERILAPKLFRDFKRTFLYKNEGNKGIPQGASISAVLANVYMVDLDQAINDYVLRKNGLYLRYCDDFIIILPLHHHENHEVLSSVIDLELSALSYRGFDSLWSTYGLNLNVEKTHLFLIQGQELKEIDFSNYCKNFDCIKNCDQSNQTFQQDSFDVASKSGCLLTPVSSPSTYQIIDDKACINFLGFSFNGKGVKIDPALIDKYNNGMRRKAKAIVDCDFTTKFNHHINCRELYRLYSGVTGEVNFVSYLKRCAATMELDDPKALDIIKNNKRNIANTLNRLERQRQKALASKHKRRARKLLPEIFR